MRALVTGIGGFAGSHLAEALVAAGWEVVGFLAPGESRRHLHAVQDRVTLREVDVADADACTAATVEAQPTCVFHLAAMAFVPESVADPVRAYDVNVAGTIHILEAIRTAALDARVIYVSSADAYGAVAEDELPIREPQPWRPLTPYAATKAAADVLAETYERQYGMPIVRARPFNHTGPRQSPQFVCADFARQLARIEAGVAEPVIRVGRLTARRDFSDVRDIVRAYVLLAAAGVPPGAYNICSERAVSISDILARLVALARVQVEVAEEPGRVRAHEVPEHRGDAARVRAATGWKPAVDLDQTLADTLAYWRGVVAHETGA